MRAWNKKKKPKHTTRLKYKVTLYKVNEILNVDGVAISKNCKKTSEAVITDDGNVNYLVGKRINKLYLLKQTI